MQSPQVGPSDLHHPVNRWPPQHHGRGSALGSASANGGRLHLADGTHATHRHRAASDRSQHHFPSYYLPSPSSHRGNWRPAVDEVSSPAAHPYHHLFAELEPPSRHTNGARFPHEYPASVDMMHDAGDEDFFIDISALADQYLDLSEHCPVPSRSRSPYSDSTQSEGADINQLPSKRGRVTEHELPPLPSTHVSDDEFEGEGHPGGTRTGLSPFYHSPSPALDAAPPARSHQSHSSHPTHPASRPAGPTLKFTEARKDGRSNRQALACFFCRKRKIACGGPSKASGDQTCNQCARRHVPCEYPNESRRGQHSRIKSLARRGQDGQNVCTLLPILPRGH
ncbi:hypothetical protein DFH09DRAFT_1209504 [Mycena vulgaris]|nr:hypothetical protein DFH09DRAFT_1209504 [Mycena vulgaris]